MRKQPLAQTALFQPWSGLPRGADPFRLLVESIRDYAIYLLDAEGVVRSWNTGAEAIHGCAAEDIIGRHFSLLYIADDVAHERPERHLQMATRLGRYEDQGWRVRKDGQRFLASVALTALRDDDGELYGFASITRDLTDESRRDAELKRTQDRSTRFWNEAIKDPLTGAYNRRYMNEHLRGAIHRAGDVTASLLLFDLDHFKEVNDRFGHGRGDAVLSGVAAVARGQLREGDMLFRLGGDEFVLYLPGTGRSVALAVAERLRAAVERAHLLPGRQLTISVGVAQRAPGETPERWLEAADAALYRAKGEGRNRIG